MIQMGSDGWGRFSLFSQFPELFCQFSTRAIGALDIRKDGRNSSATQEFLRKFPDTIAMEQIHKGSIQKVTKNAIGKVISSIDGMYTKDQDILLSVSFADCVPVFFYDPKNKLIGVAHSGWGGTYENIAGSMIQTYRDMGVRVEDIYCAIGPHIAGCCYEISAGLAEKFLKLFPSSSIICSQNQNKWFLDLGQAVLQQLLIAGVMPGHIDTTVGCTSCQNGRYFSYRKNKGTSQYGQMIGIIGMKV